MNYCESGHYIPDHALACPECATARGEVAFRKLQLGFLRKAIEGDPSYTLRIARGGDRHVLMYTSWVRTFCGKDLKTKPQISYEDCTETTLSKICTGCRVEIRRALEELP